MGQELILLFILGNSPLFPFHLLPYLPVQALPSEFRQARLPDVALLGQSCYASTYIQTQNLSQVTQETDDDRNNREVHRENVKILLHSSL